MPHASLYGPKSTGFQRAPMMRMRLRCLLPTEMRNWIDCLTAPLVSETPSKHSQASSSSASLGWAGGWSLWIEHLDPPSPPAFIIAQPSQSESATTPPRIN